MNAPLADFIKEIIKDRKLTLKSILLKGYTLNTHGRLIGIAKVKK